VMVIPSLEENAEGRDLDKAKGGKGAGPANPRLRTARPSGFALSGVRNSSIIHRHIGFI
jgi:hypothetical protein